MMSVNNQQGRDLRIDMSENGGNNWKAIGGVGAKGISRDNPVSDATSQSSSGDETEACYNGYSTVTIDANGWVDERFGDNLIEYKKISAIANSTNPLIKARFTDDEEIFESDWWVTNFKKNSDQNGIVEYSFTLQNSRDVWIVFDWYAALEKFGNQTLPDAWEDINYGTDFS